MLPLRIDGGERVAGGQLRQLDTPPIEEGAGTDKEGVRSITNDGVESFIDAAAGTGIEDLDLQIHSASGRIHILQ
jgi:hypothetical protein